MSDPDLTNTAQWLYKAKEARDLAEVMRDQKAKRMMLNIAAGYERLAEHVASLATNRATSDDHAGGASARKAPAIGRG
jgi:hypothetical protein